MRKNPLTPELKLEYFQKMTLMDDPMMTLFFRDNILCTEILLRTLLDRTDFSVKSVRVQEELDSFVGRSVRLDIVAKSNEGELFNIEFQKLSRGATAKRGRFYASAIDMHTLKKGESFEKLPDVWVIFLVTEDPDELGWPVYTHEVLPTDPKVKALNFGLHFVYVNAAYRGNNALGDILHDTMCSNPSQMRTPAFRERMLEIKTNPKIGEEVMMKTEFDYYLDEIREFGRDQGLEEGLEEGLKKGREEGLKKGREEGLKKGREEGLKDANRLLQTNMIQLGYSAEQIQTLMASLEASKLTRGELSL